MYQYRRRLTREVPFGALVLGGYQPVRVESMTNMHTMDTEATVAQCRRLYEAGCEIIRLTVPTEKDAENLRNIRDQLRRDGIATPLVADIHFSPKAALKAVEFVENIRVNPGNYAARPKFSSDEYSEEEYLREIEHVRTEFTPLVEKARQFGVSMRIGTNHGSLSDRIVSRFGNSPEGMVEAALEFARICEELGYYDILFSMKASNVRVMIQAYRLLVEKADGELKHAYPLHLGVTEAGDGDEGRVKSAMGIGALLEDGLGDTIRVSLTEDPVNEVPVGFAIVKKYNDFQLVKGDRGHIPIGQVVENRNRHNPSREKPPFSPFSYQRRLSRKVELAGMRVGGDETVRVETELHTPLANMDGVYAEALKRLAPEKPQDAIRSELVSVRVESSEDLDHLEQLQARLGDHARFVAASTGDISLFVRLLDKVSKARFDIVEGERLDKELLSHLKGERLAAVELCFLHEQATASAPAGVLLHLAEQLHQQGCERLFFSVQSNDALFATRRLVQAFNSRSLDYPLIVRYRESAAERLDSLISTSVQTGTLFCDGIGDMLALQTGLSVDDEVNLAFNILQGARVRMSKTEFISCPGCGRTYFELEQATAAIKKRMAHLKGLKIGIMGCIVNGPGEMADADFGYVGAGKNRINLYVGRECVDENISEQVAVDRLIELVKERGKWVDPV
ncbi:(E)-4-hydroxy-3-methylbut-2-enyl-diphosphate synthase [Chlorobium sp. BLA1]|uniref:(E)-4-hydroxy-3-methylbut-2-enyl-diphosphate synthase n=1 Tax=Candidatus Chlorobium masyuteum TaxID=2716876 RepID=UPI00141E6A68|nr:(E)-4-hydroxy-3-methylbut-2-enyl-diphosphate synthase [Candidatus Chlorobium masyuteum]NHQ59810.1 (E)-4-hydroxy-3-methylbut-2-enyl-diphosphate synthase [Candidatus Chlorobium masyuteum]